MTTVLAVFRVMSISGAVAMLVPLAAWGLPEGEPALPSDSEVSTFIAIWDQIASDPGLAQEACAAAGSDDGDAYEEYGEDEDYDESGDYGDYGGYEEELTAAQMGAKLEASPTFGPILRRQAISGARFVEVSMHVFSGMLGLGMADDLDAAERGTRGRGARREAVLRDLPAARLVAAHQAELDPVMQRAAELCSSEGSEEEEDDWEE